MPLVRNYLDRGYRRVIAKVAPRSTPRVHWFRDRVNLGDALSPFVVAETLSLDRDPVWVEASYSGKLLAVGSLLENIASGDIVWGTGTFGRQEIQVPESARVIAVRGPLTATKLTGIDSPTVYGDPALLLPEYWKPDAVKSFDVGLIPHLDEVELFPATSGSMLRIDVRRPWREVVAQIRSCHAVISSALHGIIVAEAYGIPAAWVELTGWKKGGLFKFHDYLLSTDREPATPVPLSEGIDRALQSTLGTPSIDLAPLKSSLIRAFEPSA